MRRCGRPLTTLCDKTLTTPFYEHTALPTLHVGEAGHCQYRLATIAELAEREGIAPSYMTRVLRLTLLAPDIVVAILMQLPPRMIECIVVHELVHIKFPDHSENLWKTLGSAMPEYECRKAWLKKKGGELSAHWHSIERSLTSLPN